jgi:hypothetical protein
MGVNIDGFHTPLPYHSRLVLRAGSSLSRSSRSHCGADIAADENDSCGSAHDAPNEIPAIRHDFSFAGSRTAILGCPVLKTEWNACVAAAIAKPAQARVPVPQQPGGSLSAHASPVDNKFTEGFGGAGILPAGLGPAKTKNAGGTPALPKTSETFSLPV